MNNSFESVTGYDQDDDEENVPLGCERNPITLPAPRVEMPTTEDQYPDVEQPIVPPKFGFTDESEAGGDV